METAPVRVFATSNSPHLRRKQTKSTSERSDLKPNPQWEQPGCERRTRQARLQPDKVEQQGRLKFSGTYSDANATQHMGCMRCAHTRTSRRCMASGNGNASATALLHGCRIAASASSSAKYLRASTTPCVEDVASMGMQSNNWPRTFDS
eukprot:6183523-Pleurochrysis_carterae.AAC.7